MPDELHSTPSLPGVDTSSLVLAAARETLKHRNEITSSFTFAGGDGAKGGRSWMPSLMSACTSDHAAGTVSTVT